MAHCSSRIDAREPADESWCAREPPSSSEPPLRGRIVAVGLTALVFAASMAAATFATKNLTQKKVQRMVEMVEEMGR